MGFNSGFKGLIRVLYRNFPAGTEEKKLWKTAVTIDVWAKI